MANEGKRGKQSGAEPWLPVNERKVAQVMIREMELEEIAPVLMSMPWRMIRAGLSRVRDIGRFIKHYEMYAPLLAERKDVLIEARDSGRFKSFELRASAKSVEVEGIDLEGNRVVIVVVRKHYWEDVFSPGHIIFTPW